MTIEFIQLLLLIIIANGSPIAIRVLLNNRFDTAVDFGQMLPDNKPLFGPSKTWRGIIAALCITAAMAWVIGYTPVTGVQIAAWAVCGDLFSSFVKRRLGMPASSMAPLLDQVPESLFPAYMLKSQFKLETGEVIILVLIFIITELMLSHVFYKWGIRKHPY